jgi:hypothetical protein
MSTNENRNTQKQSYCWFGDGYVELYMGEWSGPLLHGQGHYLWYSSSNQDGYKECTYEYIGEYRNGRRHGFGTMYYSDGSVYYGDWYDDEKHGAGAFIFADGEVVQSVFPVDNSSKLVRDPSFKPLYLDDLFLRPDEYTCILNTVRRLDPLMRTIYNKFRRPPNAMTMKEFWSFCEASDIINKDFIHVDVNRCVCRSQCVRNEMENPINKGVYDVHSPNRRMYFRHFVEGIVRILVEQFGNIDKLESALSAAEPTDTECKSVTHPPHIKEEIDAVFNQLASKRIWNSPEIMDQTVTIMSLKLYFEEVPGTVLPVHSDSRSELCLYHFREIFDRL